MRLSEFDLQRLLTAAGRYSGRVDGDLGPESMRGVNGLLEDREGEVKGDWRRWGNRRRAVAAGQLILRHAGYEEVGDADGLVGHLTVDAFTEWEEEQRTGKRPAPWRPDDNFEEPDPGTQLAWGKQRDIERRFGKAGGPQCTAGKVNLPFTARLAWDKSSKLRRFSCHEDVAQSAERVYARVASAYSPADISKWGLDLFGGCFNFRKKRGGRTLSTHAYGVALDTDPERNMLRWNRSRAVMARPELEEWWLCWEAEGWLSLGRARDFDWMHVQAPGL